MGADGLNSRVRRTTHDGGGTPERYLGYCAVAFITSGYPRRDEHVYLSFAAPGQQISRFALRDSRTGCESFSGCGWIEWPEIRRHLEGCMELYFDSVSQIELGAWSKGRIALVGDAAYAPSLLAGEGSALAMAGAYILAGELRHAAGHVSAFAAYEQKFRPFLERKQKAARAFASSFAPKTRIGLWIRDLVLRSTRFPPIGKLLMRGFVKHTLSLPLY